MSTSSESSKSESKMKFLDSLFDSPSEQPSTCQEKEKEPEPTHYERSYIKLEESKLNCQENFEKSYNKEKDSPRLLRKMSKIFGLKIWMGTLLSFFLLCYVFSFRLIVVVPLLFLALIAYTVMCLGHKYYLHYVRVIRHYIRGKFLKEKCDEDEGPEYRLMEI